MAIIRAGFDTTTNKDLLKTGALRKIFDNTVREAKTEYQVLCNDKTTSDEYERDQEMSGLVEAVEVVEGQNIPIQAPTLGHAKTYTQRMFGAGFRMTFKMDYFNKYNLWKRWARDLGKIQKESKDIEIAVMFNDPDSTTLDCGTGFDSNAIADTTHDNPDHSVATYSNYGNAAMAITSIQNARYYFATLKDSNGKWVGAIPTVLYYEPTLHFTANEIFGSSLKAHEMSNTINVLGEMNLKLFEYHRLTTTTHWGMAAPNDPDYDFNVLTSMEPRMFEKSTGDNTLDKIMITLQMFTYGHNGLEWEQSHSENSSNSVKPSLWEIYKQGNTEPSPLWEGVETGRGTSLRDEGTVQPTNTLSSDENRSGMWGDARLLYCGYGA